MFIGIFTAISQQNITFCVTPSDFFALLLYLPMHHAKWCNHQGKRGGICPPILQLACDLLSFSQLYVGAPEFVNRHPSGQHVFGKYTVRHLHSDSRKYVTNSNLLHICS